MRRALRNLSTTYLGYAVAIGAGLVVTPILFNALGAEGYGVWAFIGSLAVFLNLLDFGVGPSVVRFVAEAQGRGDRDESNATASTALVLYGAVGALATAVGVALSWLVPVLVDPPADLVWPARVATFIVVLGIAARFPLGLFGSLLQGRQRFDVPALSGLVANVLLAVLVVALVSDSDDLVLVAAITAGLTVFRLAVPLAWVRRVLPELRFQMALVTRERLRRLLSVSWHNFLVHVAGKVVLSADVVIVGIVLGAKAAALYGVPARLFAMATATAAAGPTLLLPAFAELEGADQRERQRAYLLTGLRAATALTLLVALPLALIPDLFLEAWIDADLDESVPVLALLAVALIPHQIVVLGTQYLLARDRQRALARTLTATVTVNLVLSVALAATVGIWGVALATLATEVVVGFVLVPRLLAATAGLRIADVLRATLRPVLPALVVAGVVLVGFARVASPDSLLELMPIGAAWVAAFALGVAYWGFASHERAFTRRLLRLRPGSEPAVEAP